MDIRKKVAIVTGGARARSRGDGARGVVALNPDTYASAPLGAGGEGRDKATTPLAALAPPHERRPPHARGPTRRTRWMRMRPHALAHARHRRRRSHAA